jgi:prefoldin alpha subunit
MEKLPEKVEQYEKFLNEKLKTDLNTILTEREQIFGEIAEYLQIRTTIEKIIETRKTDSNNNTNSDLRTKVDLGCNFYVNAIVPDPSTVFISIGYGFFLEMKLDEALTFIEKKVKFLNTNVDDLTKQASVIKANIRLVLEGLREIQNLDFATETKPIS